MKKKILLLSLTLLTSCEGIFSGVEYKGATIRNQQSYTFCTTHTEKLTFYNNSFKYVVEEQIISSTGEGFVFKVNGYINVVLTDVITGTYNPKYGQSTKYIMTANKIKSSLEVTGSDTNSFKDGFVNYSQKYGYSYDDALRLANGLSVKHKMNASFYVTIDQNAMTFESSDFYQPLS